MIKELTYRNVTWIDVESPTEDEVASIAKRFDIHPIIAAELATESDRSKVDLYDNFMYLILHFPTCHACFGRKAEEYRDTEEMDFIVGKNFIITTHYDQVEAVHEFSKLFETTALLDKERKEVHAGFVFFYILRHLYQSLAPGLDSVNTQLKAIEDRVFSGNEKANIKDLSEINRTLLDFRWALKSHKPVLNSLEAAGKDFFGSHFDYYLESIMGEYEKIWNLLESSRETFSDLRETNDSLLSIKTNEVVKNLTVITFIFYPLTFIASIFGMNAHLPIIGQPHDFEIIGVIMLVTGLVTIILAKYQKWL